MEVSTETTAPSGVSAPASAEAQFQSLFDQGAFDANGKKPTVEEGATPPARNEQGQFKSPGQEAPPSEGKQPATAEQTAETEQEQTQEQEFASLDDLLKSKEIDPETVRALPVTVKIDGVEKQVPLSEVLKSYQLEGHVNNKSIELSNAQKQFVAEQEAARQLIAQQLQNNQALGNLAQQQLNYEFNQVDWNALRASDPGRYAAMWTDFQSRQQAIQGYLGEVRNQQSAAEQQSQAALASKIESERSAMLDKYPEWKDPAAFASARDSMMNYAKSLGFTDAELGRVYDHRLMSVLHDAASFRALQAAKPEALKQVRAAPKMAKPGSRQISDPTQATRQAAIERFNSNPRDLDAAAALFEVLA